MGNEPIKHEDAALLLTKLLDERIPLRAFMRIESHTHVHLAGYVDSITRLGLVVAEHARNPIGGNGMSFEIGDPAGSECSFFFADEREIPEESRAYMSKQYGNTMLLVTNNRSGHWLALIYNS
jgi:hypothetical protein